MSDSKDSGNPSTNDLPKSPLEQALEEYDAKKATGNTAETEEKMENLPLTPEDTAPPEENVEVPKSSMFNESPKENMLRDVLADIEGIEPSTTDKQMYLKAMLNDVPVKLDVNLCGGRVVVAVRARTTWEQSCIYEAVRLDTEEKLIDGMASVILQLQKYGSVSLENKSTLEDCVTLLRSKRAEIMDGMNTPKWSLLLNALRVFETKMATMGSECLNENFWEPVD
jgi:hypothetical protein